VRLYIALALCAALVAVVSLVPKPMIAAAVPYFPWLRLVAGAVVVADARRIGIARYATGLGTRGIVWFAVAALWPIVALPWYLTVRERVRAGLTPLRVRDPS
jgi:uncharacterized membrane protein (GlpM family)